MTPPFESLVDRQPAMAVLDGVSDDARNSGAQAYARSARHADAGRDAVRLRESEARQVERKPVGIGRDRVDGRASVSAMNAREQRFRNSMVAQERRQVAQRAVLIPRFRDYLRPARPDAMHAGQGIGLT